VNEFADRVAGERRKLDAEAAAGRREQQERAALAHARERDDQAAWDRTLERIFHLLTAAVEHLRAERVPPLPVLTRRPAPWRPSGMETVNRTVVIGHRWLFADAFALDKRCNAYPATAPRPLLTDGRRTTPSQAQRLSDYVLHGRGSSFSERTHRQTERSLLRTGLAPDQLVLWGPSTEDDGIDFDPAAGARAGRIHCFGRADDDTPLLLRGTQSEPLEAFLARTVAQLLTASR
jgi:hypothetical protein